MEKPISVGDMVQVIRYPCCGSRLGRLSIVIALDLQNGEEWNCSGCGTKLPPMPLIEVREGIKTGFYPAAWLKRIPPFGELRGKKDAADKPITLDSYIERLRKMVSA